jgi:hypothetical protein
MLTAVGLCTEIGDFERFAKAEQLMSRAGSETAQDLLLARSGEARTRGRRRKTLALAPVTVGSFACSARDGIPRGQVRAPVADSRPDLLLTVRTSRQARVLKRPVGDAPGSER